MKNLFSRIRGLYGMDSTISEEPKAIIPGSEKIPSESESEDDLVTVDIKQMAEKIRTKNPAENIVKGPEYYGENVTKPEFTFMQNLEAVALELGGIGKGPGKPYVNKNVTDSKNTFLQNLDAISLEFSGNGTGPVEIQTENSYDPKKSLDENLMQSILDSEGNGETVEVSTQNVTDPKKSMMENLDAIGEEFRGMEAGTGKIKVEKKKSVGR